jgi:hypothetical protein
MADYDTRWRSDQGYRRDDRDRWRGESRDWGGEEPRRYGREDFGHYGREEERGQWPGYGYEGYGREGYDYGRDYWRQAQDPGRGSYQPEDYGRAQGRDYGRQGYGGQQGYGEWAGGTDYGQDFGTSGTYGGFGRPDYRGRGPRGYTRSDDRIREDINDRLTEDPYVDASEIDVTVSNCEVKLAGTVDSRVVKRRAEDLVESVSGVRHVQNNLRVRQPSYTGAGTAAGASAMAGLGTGGASETTGSSDASNTSSMAERTRIGSTTGQ